MNNSFESITYPIPKLEYKVLVRCFTYNQSKYIEDALNGFAMQQTIFPFVCLVVDDASTDGEQEVIKVWMDRECDMSRAETIDIPTSIVIIVPHKSNASATFAFYLLKQNLYNAKEEKKRHITPWREKCEYEAMCEGDDYWIDPLKLQKQINYLDNNPRVSIFVHNAIRKYSNGQEEKFNKNISTGTYSLRKCLYMSWFTPTASFVFRNKKISPLWHKNNSNGDMAILYTNLMKGELYYSDEIMSVYNYGTLNSLSSLTSKLSLYDKKLGMLRTINQLSCYKYILWIFPVFIYYMYRKIVLKLYNQ